MLDDTVIQVQGGNTVALENRLPMENKCLNREGKGKEKEVRILFEQYFAVA